MEYNWGNTSTPEEPEKFKKILVAVSGNTSDEDAITFACILAKKSRAVINVVYIVEVKRSLPIDAVIKSDLNKAEHILNRAEDIAADNDYEIKTDILQAREAGVAIVDNAAEKDIDLILMGLDYKKRFGMFHLGDVIPYVLEEAPCRVLLIRRPMAGKGKS
jgi:nucleotide-binding universal stress UspA family protein